MATIKRGKQPLLITNPDLAKEWDYEKNAPLTPGDIYSGSSKKAWWICEKRHSWDAVISNRNKGAGCPICSGQRVLAGYNDLQTLNPTLSKEWDYGKNEPLKPSEVTCSSGRKVWWVCDKGHSYEASIAHRNDGTSCPICSGQRVLKGFNDLAYLYPDLATQWNYEKNEGLRDQYNRDISAPDRITANSGQKVWWVCKEGHAWQAAVYSRSHGDCGCPVCANQVVLAGYNDLETTSPDIAKEWDFEKNDSLLPSMVLGGTQRKVWWICSKGHSYQASIASRTGSRKGGCPICSGRQVLIGYNDLATTNPDIAKEWDYEKNVPTKPNEISEGTHYRAWWICPQGHSYQSPVYQRVQGNGCPYCSGRRAIVGETDLQTINPQLAKMWNYEKNGSLKPTDVSAGSNKTVWWICEKGHEWKAKIGSRHYFDLGCPFCSNKRIIVGFNDLATVAPLLAAEWNYDKNGELKPTDITCGSGKKVWWICEKGHEWKADVCSRYSGNGCPICSNAGSSMPEQGIAFYLSKSCKIEQRKKIANQEVDIFITQYNIGIEYDGVYYHKNKDRDNKKDMILREAGIKIIRVIESRDNSITKDGYICFRSDDMGTNYEWALNELFLRISELTGEDSFKNIKVDVKSDRLKIRERFSLVQKESSVESKYPELVEQWNHNKNGILKPDMFSYGSKEKVWWVCKEGHEWQASISNRIKGRGCPVCNNRIIIPGINDLETLNPILAKEWDYDKNGELLPNGIALNARKNVWWICPSCNGEYQSWVYSRASGVGCPYCCIPAKKVLKGYNDLATKKPELLSEWDYKKNPNILPEEILPGSNKKVWWLCEKGHSWEASVVNRFEGKGCPYCAGRRVLRGFNDLETCNPLLAQEWNYEKNEGLTPDMITPGSNKKVWWKCSFGHEWSANICNRSKGVGCPICHKNTNRKAQNKRS